MAIDIITARISSPLWIDSMRPLIVSMNQQQIFECHFLSFDRCVPWIEFLELFHIPSKMGEYRMPNVSKMKKQQLLLRAHILCLRSLETFHYKHETKADSSSGKNTCEREIDRHSSQSWLSPAFLWQTMTILNSSYAIQQDRSIGHDLLQQCPHGNNVQCSKISTYTQSNVLHLVKRQLNVQLQEENEPYPWPHKLKLEKKPAEAVGIYGVRQWSGQVNLIVITTQKGPTRGIIHMPGVLFRTLLIFLSAMRLTKTVLYQMTWFSLTCDDLFMT